MEGSILAPLHGFIVFGLVVDLFQRHRALYPRILLALLRVLDAAQVYAAVLDLSLIHI